MTLRCVVRGLTPGALALLALLGCSREAPPGTSPAAAGLEALVRCLSEKGAVYYGASGCAACRTQEGLFGSAFEQIAQVECHPHAPGSQAERCVARGIRVTPTWLLEGEGREPRRLEGARSPEELAAFAGCPPAAPASRPGEAPGHGDG